MIKVDDGHGFFNVQLAWMAVGVDAIEIVEAISEVGVLLHFTKNHSRAAGVRGAGGNEKSVAGKDRQAFEEVFQAAVFDGGLEFLALHSGQ